MKGVQPKHESWLKHGFHSILQHTLQKLWWWTDMHLKFILLHSESHLSSFSVTHASGLPPCSYLQGTWSSSYHYHSSTCGPFPGLPVTVSLSDPVWPDSPSATCCLEPALKLSYNSHVQWHNSPVKKCGGGNVIHILWHGNTISWEWQLL